MPIASVPDVEVELLTVPARPHRELALERVRAALALVGAGTVVVAEHIIDDTEVARAVGMHGSPTVLIDGRDPFAIEGSEGSVSCRLYRTEAGLDGAPSTDELVIALSRSLKDSE